MAKLIGNNSILREQQYFNIYGSQFKNSDFICALVVLYGVEILLQVVSHPLHTAGIFFYTRLYLFLHY